MFNFASKFILTQDKIIKLNPMYFTKEIESEIIMDVFTHKLETPLVGPWNTV